MTVAFLLTSLIWTGLAAALAEALARPGVDARFAQAVWRGGATLMALPWLALVLAPVLPSALPVLPDFPDLPGFTGAALIPAGDTVAAPNLPGAGLDLDKLLLLILCLGWAVRAAAALAGHFRLAALLHNAPPITDPATHRMATHWSGKLGLRRTPALRTLAHASSPFVAGVFRPRLCLPATLAASPHGSLIIAHECIHIARGDLITRPLERVIADLLWFSPFAWLARARLDYWREAVCDAETVRLTEAPAAYARALSHTARASRPAAGLPVAPFILHRRKTLPMRLSAILSQSPATPRARIALGLAAGLIAAPLALAQGLAEPDTDTAQSFGAPVVSLQDARITSHYGLRKDPFTGSSAWHSGTDIAGMPTGTPLASPAAGQVIFAGRKPGYGLLVDVKLDTSGHVVRYGQLSELKVDNGASVASGDIVGLVGSSGRATGPHLHIEYMIDQRPYDPAEIEGLTLVAQQ